MHRSKGHEEVAFGGMPSLFRACPEGDGISQMFQQSFEHCASRLRGEPTARVCPGRKDLVRRRQNTRERAWGGATGVDSDALTVQGRCERRRPASDPSRTAKRGGAAQAAVVAAATGFAVGGRTWRPRARGYTGRSLPSFAHWQPYFGVGRPSAPSGETSASSGARRSSLNRKTISFSIQVQFHCPTKDYKFKK